MSDFGSGHDLTVREFKPCIGLCAVSAEPASDPLSPSLSACLSKMNKTLKKKKNDQVAREGGADRAKGRVTGGQLCTVGRNPVLAGLLTMVSCWDLILRDMGAMGGM